MYRTQCKLDQTIAFSHLHSVQARDEKSTAPELGRKVSHSVATEILKYSFDI